MGMQGPLTAQALGRSPYDDVVQGEGEEDPREPSQQYDHGGRPINPDTMRMNRDIIRSHNEVMLVIGVAEPENPNAGPEADLQRRHEAHEESIGLKLASAAKRCVESVGIFGVNGLRDRILIYKRYSRIPFWELYQLARRDFSFCRDILPGVPASFLTSYVESYVTHLWFGEREKALARRSVHEVWSYFRVHLELFIAMQRLGLIPSSQWLPGPLYFVPFSRTSPFTTPPPLASFETSAILRWLGGVFIAMTPFLVWSMSQRLLRDWRPQIWTQIFKRLPSTAFRGKAIPPAPPSSMNEPTGDSYAVEDGVSPLPATDSQPSDTEPVETVRRPSVFSMRDDDYASDEENDGMRATLISFDVEATESSADAPQGLWSAELRPSVGTDSRSGMSILPIYFDTLLTQIPALIATHIFTNTATRILLAPYEATALRLAARTFRLRSGLSCEDIHPVNVLAGLNGTLTMNYLGVELLHLVLSSEVWGVFTGLSQWYHMSEEEYKEQQDNLESTQ
ncbi:hypothetical protein PT974_06859 [Cladobotryum mycophilum]|uniref:Uncharacterized protein n=1 Tax=Cladobotryum mycophilum TaxID=491253 RepID=A0ABR0SMU2_9HYPO